MTKCSHCEQERFGRCSYADCPFEQDQLERIVGIRDEEIASLRQQVERLEKEKAELLDDIKCSFGNTNAALDDYREALARAERAEAKLARFREPDEAMVERASKAYAEATGYYVEFHRGLKSVSADQIRKGVKAAITAALEAKK